MTPDTLNVSPNEPQISLLFFCDNPNEITVQTTLTYIPLVPNPEC